MLRQYIKLALRNIVRQRGYAAINLTGLAVSLAFTLLIFSWVRYEYSVDSHHENLNDLYIVAFTCDSDKFHGDFTVGALGPYLCKTYPEITHASRYASTPGIPFEYDGEQYSAVGRFVDPDFFTMFSFDFTEGTPQNAFNGPLSIVLTRSMAGRIFGNDAALGNALRVDEEVSLTVSAVIDDPPATSSFQFDYLLSCAINPGISANWDVKTLNTFVMLAPGSAPEVVSEKIRDVYNDHNPGTYPNYQYLFPLRDLHLHGLNGDGRILYVRVFSILALIVLLIACINFMSLSTARAVERYREIGVKKALGAGRGQLACQFLLETGLITVTATLIALVLVEIFLPQLNTFAKTHVVFDFSWGILGVLLAIVVGTSLLAGSYPAFYLSAFRPVHVLCGSVSPFENRRSGRGKRFRQVMVVLQFTASIALVLGAMGIFGQLLYVQNMDVGFNKDHVVIFNVPRQAVKHTATIKSQLLDNPDIASVTVSSNSLIRWQSSLGIDWQGKEPGKSFDVGRNWVDYDYAKTFQIDMVAGRFFSPDFPSDKTEAFVINEACVRAMGISDPVGRNITLAPGSSIETKGTIIGVIRDHHTESAHTEIRPFLLAYTDQGYHMCVRVHPDKMASSIRFIRETVSDVAPGADVYYRFYDDMTAALYEDEILTGIVVTYVTVIAIFISCLGLFGLAAFTARQRAKEISIRRVLGASVASVVNLLSREFLILVIIAGLIASPLAWYAIVRWQEGFAFRMTLGPGMFISAIVIACLLGLATVAGQAYRAATCNPADNLHQE